MRNSPTWTNKSNVIKHRFQASYLSDDGLQFGTIFIRNKNGDLHRVAGRKVYAKSTQRPSLRVARYLPENPSTISLSALDQSSGPNVEERGSLYVAILSETVNAGLDRALPLQPRLRAGRMW